MKKKYQLLFTKSVKKDLKKLDRYTASLITSWIEKNLIGCEDPRAHGKALVGDKSGKWRYRIGDYRLICEIRDDELIILALTVGHRKNIYN
jgi:mRNA interferase RelE/StbE